MSVWFVNRVCRVVALRDKVSLNVYLSFHFIHCSCKNPRQAEKWESNFKAKFLLSVNLVYEPGWTKFAWCSQDEMFRCNICLVILMMDNLEMHFIIPCKWNFAPDPCALFAVHKLLAFVEVDVQSPSNLILFH